MSLFFLTLITAALYKVNGFNFPLPCGEIVNRSNPLYEEASFNTLAIYDDILPSFVIFCECEDDVIESVKQLTSNNIDFTIRSGGHNVGGYSKRNNSAIIDLSRMNKVRFATRNNKLFMRVQPGAGGREIVDFLAEKNKPNIHIPVGSSETVKYGGYIQGGGASPWSRYTGLALDHLRAARIVLANGTLVTATNNNKYSDLFFAIRGAGGGQFGVITEYILRPDTNFPKKVLYLQLTFALTTKTQILDFLKASRYIVGNEYLDHQLNVADFGAGFYFGIASFSMVPTKVFTIEDTDNEVEKFVNMTNNTPFQIDRFEESYLSIFNNTVFPNNFFPRDPGVFTSRFVFDECDINDDILNDIADNLLDIGQFRQLVYFVSYGRGKINRPRQKTAYLNRDALTVIAAIGFNTEFNTSLVPKQLAELGRYEEVLNNISTAQYMNYNENLLNSDKINVHSLYNDQRVLNQLIQIKTKYDPDNIFRIPLGIPVQRRRRQLLDNEENGVTTYSYFFGFFFCIIFCLFV